MSSLSKKDLSGVINQAVGLNKSESKELVELFFKTLNESLGAGQQIKLSGFGNFILRDKAARPGRNPKTLKEIEVSARRVVTFRAGNKLKKQVALYQEGHKPIDE